MIKNFTVSIKTCSTTIISNPFGCSGLNKQSPAHFAFLTIKDLKSGVEYENCKKLRRSPSNLIMLSKQLLDMDRFKNAGDIIKSKEYGSWNIAPNAAVSTSLQ